MRAGLVRLEGGEVEELPVPMIFEGAKVIVRGDETYVRTNRKTINGELVIFELAEVWKLHPDSVDNIIGE